MPNVTTQDLHVRIERMHAIAPDLTTDEVADAIFGALITKLGRGSAAAALNSGALIIDVTPAIQWAS